ncbi:MAG: MBL fold metallo-hydrolase [Anaerolineae bacterium]|nr:MBL fold metallo-hydrolase [Anaerolineae bacterium]
MSQQLVPIAENIWIYPTSPEPTIIQPNVGIIACGDSVVLVDAGNSPRVGRTIAAEVAMLGQGQVDTIIYTHHHWDHISGAMAFHPQRVIAHEHCGLMLRHMARRNWTHSDDESLSPEMIARLGQLANQFDRWHDFRLVQPNMTFSHQMTIYVNEVAIELEYVGGRHAHDSIVVKLPQSGVMFLGDSYYPSPMFERPAEGDDDLAIPMLEAFLAEDYAIYIDGHGQPRDRKQLTALIAEESMRQGIS